MTAPARRALLIGIDKYTKFPDKWPALNGCVADIELMRATLRDHFGFPNDNIRVLKNGMATRARILSAFDRLIQQTGTDDVVVIHYAGHGSQMTDREGDEPSGLDSTIVPVDSASWSGARRDQRDITDDEIHLRLLALGEKTSFTTLIFDCCHSGTISRDGFGAMTRSVPPDTRPVEQLPPSPIPAALQEAMRAGRTRGSAGKGRSGWLPLEGKYVLIAGCRDEEIANEHILPEGNGKLVQGALTWFLTRELRRAGPGTTYRDVFERAAANVNGLYGKQHPQLEGEADREVFGVRDIEQAPFVPVAGKRGSRIQLEAGAAHGMTVGSRYEVYPAGAKEPDGEPLGRITIKRVGGLTSSATIDDETEPGAIAAGTRAFESEHAFGEMRYRVQIHAADRFDENVGRLREEIRENYPLLKVVPSSQSADARVYLLPARTATRRQDPVPQLRVVRAPSWVVVGADGRVAAPLKRVRDHAQVARNLHTLARFRMGLELDNPDRRSKLRGKFGLDLLRLNAEGEWVEARPERARGHVVYEEGDAIAFRVTSRTSKPAFVNLLDFGLDGEVSRVFPAEGASPELRPNGFFDILTDRSRFEVSVELPSSFPFVDDPEGDAVEGLEAIKLFVTSRPADFGFLEQGAMRGGGETPSSIEEPAGSRAAASSPLAVLFDTAFNGTRSGSRSQSIGAEDWATVTRTFVVRRS